MISCCFVRCLGVQYCCNQSGLTEVSGACCSRLAQRKTQVKKMKACAPYASIGLYKPRLLAANMRYTAQSCVLFAFSSCISYEAADCIHCNSTCEMWLCLSNVAWQSAKFERRPGLGPHHSAGHWLLCDETDTSNIDRWALVSNLKRLNCGRCRCACNVHT